MNESISILKDCLKYFSWAMTKYAENTARAGNLTAAIIRALDDYRETVKTPKLFAEPSYDVDVFRQVVRTAILDGQFENAVKALEVNSQMLGVAKTTFEQLELAVKLARYGLQDYIDSHNKSLGIFNTMIHSIRKYSPISGEKFVEEYFDSDFLYISVDDLLTEAQRDALKRAESDIDDREPEGGGGIDEDRGSVIFFQTENSIRESTPQAGGGEA